MTQDDEAARKSKCEGKEGLAQSIANALKVRYRQRGRDISVYRCEFCGHWHIGFNFLGSKKVKRK